MTGDYIPKLASALDTSVAYLLGETDEPRLNHAGQAGQSTQRPHVESNVVPINPALMIRVRILDKSYHACCGVGIDWGGEAVEFEETMWLPLADLARRYGDDDVIGIYADGDSMEPMIGHGDLVLFVPHEKSIVYVGVPMVVCYNGSMIIRGIIENSNRAITLRSANKDYQDIRITDADEFDICGRVVKIHSVKEPKSVL